MMILKKIKSLDLDKMHVTSNRILVVPNGVLWDTKTHLKVYIFTCYECEMDKKEFLKTLKLRN